MSFERLFSWARARYAALSRRQQKAVLLSATSLLVALVSLVVWRSRFASLRVLSTLPEPALLIIDGGKPRPLSPVSTETPEAGLVLALSPGPHHLAVWSLEGQQLDALDITLTPSSSYLFSPGVTDQCFWIEHTAYGQARPQRAPLRLLPREQRIWAVPDEVDAWFFPTPPPGSLDRRSSGGTRTAVRQARCGFEPWKLPRQNKTAPGKQRWGEGSCSKPGAQIQEIARRVPRPR